MWLRTRSFVFVGLFVLLQINVWAEKSPEDFYEGNERIFQLQKCVERLIEKILSVVEDFYTKIRNRYKCIPEEVPDAIIEILKHSIDCLGSYEKKLQNPRLTKSLYRKLFHRCLARGRKEFQNMMDSIDPTLNYCPENMTEKIYQINITTSFTKTFNINIKNGLEITRKIIYFENDTLDADEGQSTNEEEASEKELDDGEYAEDDQLKDYYEDEEFDNDQSDPKPNSSMERIGDDENLRATNSSEENRRRKRNK